MEFLKEFLPVPTLVVICYFLSEVIKTFLNEKDFKYIPTISGLLGCLLSLFGFYLLPDFIKSDNFLSAIAIGIVSGFAATGAHQNYKQLR